MATIPCPHCSREFALPAAPSDGRPTCPHCQKSFSAPAHSPAVAAHAGHNTARPADAFDPYYNWLGIPPRDQPPHHYRLLGLELYEENLDVIDNASSRQMAHLRNCSTGARALLAQELLNKVAAARVCLLDKTKKAAYDVRLREQLLPPVPVSAPPEPTAPPEPIAAPQMVSLPEPVTPPEAIAPAAVVSRTTGRPRARRTKSPTLEVVKIVVGGLIGLGMGYVVLFVVFPGLTHRRPDSAQRSPAAIAERITSESGSSAEPSTAPELDPPRDASPAETEAGRLLPPASVVENVPASGRREAGLTTQSPAESGRVTTADSTNPQGQPATDPAEAGPPAIRTASSVPGAAPEPAKQLEQLPSSVALPPVDATAWQTLVPLPKIPDRVELVPAFDTSAAKLSLKLVPAIACDANRWKVLVEVADASSSSAQPDTLSELQVDGTSGDLQFRWQTVHPESAAALSNAWLELHFDSQTRYVAMRHPQIVAPLKLGFAKPRFVVPLAIESMPATNHLVFEVESLAGLTSSPSLRNGIGETPLDREVVIEFSDLPGAQVAIKLSKVPQAPLGLIVEPRFKEGANREYDLTFQQLQDSERGITKSLREAREDIATLTRISSGSQSQLKTAQGRTVNNKTEAAQKRIDISRLQGIIADCGERLTKAREREADAQQRLNNVPKIHALMQSLDGKEVTFRVVVKSPLAKLTLVKGMSGGGTQ